MAPEQASGQSRNLTTATDVYGLGAVLFATLTGRVPFIGDSSLDILDKVKNHEPLSPSQFNPLVDRDLDTICLKCLQKEPSVRYASAELLARDLEHYLAGEPVMARPIGVLSRSWRWCRRKPAIAALIVVSLLASFVLLVGLAISNVMIRRALDDRTKAFARLSEEEAKTKAALEGKTQALVKAQAAAESEVKQRTLAEESEKKAVREASIAAAVNDFLSKDLLRLAGPKGQSFAGLKPEADMTIRTVLQRAATRINGRFPDQPEVEMAVRAAIAYALDDIGDSRRAIAQWEKVVPYQQQTLGADHLETSDSMYRLAWAYSASGQRDKAIALFEEVFDRRKAVFGLEHKHTLQSMNGLASAYRASGQRERALELYERNLDPRRKILGPRHLDTLVSMNNLAMLYQDLERWDDARQMLEDAATTMRATVGRLHPESLNATRNLAAAYHRNEQLNSATALIEEVVTNYISTPGADSTFTHTATDLWIAYQIDLGLCDLAKAAMDQAIKNPPPSAEAKRQLGVRDQRYRDLIQKLKPTADKYQQALTANRSDHPDTLNARSEFAAALQLRQRWPAVAFHLQAILESRLRQFGADDVATLVCQIDLGSVRFQQKRFTDAESLLLAGQNGLQKLESSLTQQDKLRLSTSQQLLAQLGEARSQVEQPQDKTLSVTTFAVDFDKAAQQSAIKSAGRNGSTTQKSARDFERDGDNNRLRKEYARAISCYRSVIEKEPNNPMVLNRLAWLLTVSPKEVRDLKEALNLAERASLKDRSVFSKNTLAAVHYRLGAFTKSLQLLREIAAKSPSDFQWWSHNFFLQALCQERLGDPASAQAAYNKALEEFQQLPANSVYLFEAKLLRQECDDALKPSTGASPSLQKK